MNEQPLESFLARLYTDAKVRARFLTDPANEAQRAGLSRKNCAAVLKIDPIALQLAARSFAHKRRKRAVSPPKTIAFIQQWIGKFRK